MECPNHKSRWKKWTVIFGRDKQDSVLEYQAEIDGGSGERHRQLPEEAVDPGAHGGLCDRRTSRSELG